MHGQNHIKNAHFSLHHYKLHPSCNIHFNIIVHQLFNLPFPSMALFSFDSTYLSSLLQGQWVECTKWNISDRRDVLTTVRLIFWSSGKWHCRCDSVACQRIWVFICSDFINTFIAILSYSCVSVLKTHLQCYNIRPQRTGRESFDFTTRRSISLLLLYYTSIVKYIRSQEINIH